MNIKGAIVLALLIFVVFWSWRRGREGSTSHCVKLPGWNMLSGGLSKVCFDAAMRTVRLFNSTLFSADAWRHE
jgi:hypothetical protein